MTDATLPAEVDPLRFPLLGSHLIEASAGTGKTWTIAALYVRLILGHGGQPPRLPSDILVLTFTDAAAQELRERIRSRLAEAAALFAAPPDAPQVVDDFLSGLCADYAQAARVDCAHQLDLAAQSMDEASISTIHAWCARVLRQHAFGSGSLFDQEVRADLDEPIREVAWDYWRSQVAALDEAGLAPVLALWRDPDALMALARMVLVGEWAPPPAESLAVALEQARHARRAALQGLKQPWLHQVAVLRQWLEEVVPSLERVRPADVRRWLALLDSWAADPDQELPDLKVGWERLSAADIARRWSGDGPAPEHPLVEALAALPAAVERLPSLDATLIGHAAGWMAQRLREWQARAVVTSFDGLLAGLAQALAREGGEALAQTLRRQYPAMLVDEFQDTDPVQYEIFDRIYRVARNDPETLVVFIGDPKQSIYGFRGADVHTYLRAARDCGTRVQTLARNFRSSEAMVQAVDRLFAWPGTTPFVTGVEGESIAFRTVAAHGRTERWFAGRPAAALQAAWIESAVPDAALTVAGYRARAAVLCAQRVARLLAAGRTGRAGFGSDGEAAPLEGVRPADVAILVNRHVEARCMRQALADVGIRSVYLSERDSVFESPVALELAICLEACVRADDERAVRAALATPLLGLSFATLDALVADERAWEAQVERFQGYRERWLRQGVLPMLRTMLQDFGVPARLLAAGNEGERILTDCLHLAELLQQASARVDGQQALLRHLQQQRLTSADEDARRLRLESDEDLVRVVTIHKSKGLEYPLVFVPFACMTPSSRRQAGPLRLRCGTRSVWVVRPDAEQADRLMREQVGEEVRKLYVALTRARHAAWLTLGRLAHPERGGMAQILGPDLQAAWDALAVASDGVIAWDHESGNDMTVVPAEPAPPWGPARRLAAPVVTRPWWIASYSALQRGASVTAPFVAPPRSAAEDVLREGRRWQERALQPDAAAESPSLLQGFPRGSQAGTFLHGLLEWAAHQGFKDLAQARDVIARRCAVRGWEAHIDALHDWLLEFARTAWRPDLPESPIIRLDELPACQPEMEFWLPVDDVPVAALDDLIRDRVFATLERPPLQPARINGMFKGFIDLALQAQGRYYVLDYKSNDLGESPQAYAGEALVRAMGDARYDVQMMMYVLALHRQLGARLPDYDYERHMGGALYLFLRGAQTPGQGLLAARPPRATVEALDELLRGGQP